MNANSQPCVVQLLLGCDLSNAQVMNGTAADAFEIFLNKEAIAISQDPLAMPASRVAFAGANVEVWAGPLEAGGKVLLFLNGGSTAQNNVQFPLSLLGDFDAPPEEQVSEVTEVSCRDVWLHAACTSGATLRLAGNITVEVPVHGVRMLRLTPITQGGLPQAVAAKYEVTVEDAVSAAQFAAEQASKFRAALAPPKHAKRRSGRTYYHQPNSASVPRSVPVSSPDTNDIEPSHLSRPRMTNGAGLTSIGGGVAMRGLDSSHTGRSPYKGPSTCPTTVKWTNAFGHNNRTWRGVSTESSVAVHKSGRAFVGSGSSLWAVSMSDGATIWKFDTAVNTSQPSEFFSTPALVTRSSGNDLVIAGTGAGTVYAFSVSNGSIAWTFETGRVVIGMDGGTGRAPVTGSVVLANHSEPQTGYVGAWDGCVYAFDTASGKHIWKYQAMDVDSGTKAQVRATPAMSADGTVIHFPAGRAFYALDAATGTARSARSQMISRYCMYVCTLICLAMCRKRAVGHPNPPGHVHVADCCPVWHRHLWRLWWRIGYSGVCGRKGYVDQKHDDLP
jgi:hypothetical protein